MCCAVLCVWSVIMCCAVCVCLEWYVLFSAVLFVCAFCVCVCDGSFFNKLLFFTTK